MFFINDKTFTNVDAEEKKFFIFWVSRSLYLFSYILYTLGFFLFSHHMKGFFFGIFGRTVKIKFFSIGSVNSSFLFKHLHHSFPVVLLCVSMWKEGRSKNEEEADGKIFILRKKLINAIVNFMFSAKYFKRVLVYTFILNSKIEEYFAESLRIVNYHSIHDCTLQQNDWMSIMSGLSDMSHNTLRNSINMHTTKNYFLLIRLKVAKKG